MKKYFEEAQARQHYEFKMADDDSIYMDRYNDLVKNETDKAAKRDNMTVDEYEEKEQQDLLDAKNTAAKRTPEEKEGTAQAPVAEEPATEAKATAAGGKAADATAEKKESGEKKADFKKIAAGPEKKKETPAAEPAAAVADEKAIAKSEKK